MEEAKEWTGSEHAELICNGLWLKSVMDGKCKGETWEGMFLMGYDPMKKAYTGIWTSSQDEPASISTGSYDEKTKTWTFTGDTPMGEFRSVYTMQDADNSTETCYLKGSDGKEVECMKITRKRVVGGPKDASMKVSKLPAKAPAALVEAVAPLASTAGQWKATTTCQMEGQPADKHDATEQVIPINEGKWYWSSYKGSMMGQPFTGHSLMGWDPTSEQYVAFWIDSGSAQFAKVEGQYDAGKKAFEFEGQCIDHMGDKAKIHEVLSQESPARQASADCPDRPACPGGARRRRPPPGPPG
jgi:hypothetical protein